MGGGTNCLVMKLSCHCTTPQLKTFPLIAILQVNQVPQVGLEAGTGGAMGVAGEEEGAEAHMPKMEQAMPKLQVWLDLILTTMPCTAGMPRINSWGQGW